MKTMFKKTLLAVALAGVGVSANAATVAQVTATAPDYSKQYVASLPATDAVTASFTILLNAEYKNDDVVTIKFSSPLKTATSAPSSIVAALDATGAPVAPVDDKAVITLGLLTQTADTWTYRVTDVNKTNGNTTIGTYLVFDTAAAGANAKDDVQFTAGTLLSVADIKVTYAAKTATGNFDIDTGDDNTKKILAAANEFKTVVDTKLAGSVVLPARATLTGQENLATTFTRTAGLRNPVTVGATAVTYTLEGDFSWLKDDDDTAGSGLNVVAGAITGLSAGCSLTEASSSATKLVFACATTAGLDFAFDPAANTAGAGLPAATAGAGLAQTLKATKFALTTKVAYTVPTGTETTLSAVDAGEWKVDGVYVDVPYLLTGMVGEKEFSYVVNVTNNHSQAGNITLDVYKEDGTAVATRVAAGSVAPNAIKRLGTDIKAILGNDFKGRFSAKVFVEVPAGKAQVYSAYTDNETSERAIVINSTN